MPSTDELARESAALKALRASGSAAELRFRRGASLFVQGEPARSVLFITRGRVKLTVLSERGKAVTVGMSASGEFCGEAALAGHPLRLTSAQALTEGQALRLRAATMARLLESDASIAGTFTSHLLGRVQRLEADVIDQRLHSSEQRLARRLLLLAGIDGKAPASRTLPPITQEALAEMIGTTRSRVNVFLRRFKQRGFISYDGRLEIRSSLKDVLEGAAER